MIVVLNFGSQFAHLIARRVRELGVRAEILPFDASLEEITKENPEGIILSGGPSSVCDKGSPAPNPKIFALGIPVLGICYGHQLMGAQLHGNVRPGRVREFGKETFERRDASLLFAGWGKRETVWFSHGDTVTKLPKGFARIGLTHGCPNAAIADARRGFYAVQFHPEVAHTPKGKVLLANFLFRICRAAKDWKMSDYKKELITSLRREVGKSHVLVGVSGGVDSLVAATLLYRAVGNQVHAVCVDTGLLRENEARDVAQSLRKLGFRNFHLAHAQEVFLKRLRGVTDPEEKRKIIGHTFIEVFERTIKQELKKHSIQYFAQGTIYPDRIESAAPSKHAAKIKSHHNLTLPEKLHFKVIEPLKDLYKDEVRAVGESLGLPRELLWRHPFPGPGLAIRIVGEVALEKLDLLRRADAIYLEELKKSGEYEKIWQAFAALLSVKSVGVMGDARTYDYILSLRAVDSVDGMTANWHKMPQPLLERISSRIVNEVRGVNRVLYDVTQKPPGTIEYE
jgi:GMP synthase (glutamine-hydrolysing)